MRMWQVKLTAKGYLHLPAALARQYFPNDLLAPYGIESQHPDEFVDNLLDLDAAAVVSAAQRQRAQLKHPPIDVDRYLEILLRQGLVQTTKVLATYRTIL